MLFSMIEKKLFIYQNIILYNILHELEEATKYKIYHVDSMNLKSSFQDVSNNLLITGNRIDNINNQFQLDNLPINFLKLLENINIYFLKQNFKNQSKIHIGKFSIDINSRRLLSKNTHINLTEKEINLILFLFNNKTPCSIEKLQSNVWGFKKDLETHTVETHVHRLRKKVLKKFDEDKFIIFGNNGYFIKT
jgi:DNA-binding response OmpR family regulator